MVKVPGSSFVENKTSSLKDHVGREQSKQVTNSNCTTGTVLRFIFKILPRIGGTFSFVAIVNKRGLILVKYF